MVILKLKLIGLINFTWKNLENNIEQEPTIIFADEWEWKKLPLGKGRVYVLKNKVFVDTVHIFWMQSNKITDDEYNEVIVTNILRTGNLEELNENPQGADVEMKTNDEHIQKEEAKEVVKEEIKEKPKEESKEVPKVHENKTTPQGNIGDHFKNLAQHLKKRIFELI